MTPYLKDLVSKISNEKEIFFSEEDKRKEYADKFRRPHPSYQVGDQVLHKSHIISSTDKGISS